MSAEDLASKNYNKNEIDSAILNQLLVQHQKLEKITSEQKRTENPESAGAWIRWSVSIMLAIVGVVCILVSLQSYRLLPKYNDEQHYEARLADINSSLNRCLQDRHDLVEKLYPGKLFSEEGLKLIGTAAVDTVAQHSVSEIGKCKEELKECKTQLLTAQNLEGKTTKMGGDKEK